MTKAERREILAMINDRKLRADSIAVAESGRTWFRKHGMSYDIRGTKRIGRLPALPGLRRKK